jgi:hypothetical protein
MTPETRGNVRRGAGRQRGSLTRVCPSHNGFHMGAITDEPMHPFPEQQHVVRLEGTCTTLGSHREPADQRARLRLVDLHWAACRVKHTAGMVGRDTERSLSSRAAGFHRGRSDCRGPGRYRLAAQSHGVARSRPVRCRIVCLGRVHAHHRRPVRGCPHHWAACHRAVP